MTPRELKPDWGRMSTSTGYPVVYCPDHPRAWSTGYVYAHVLVMERKLDRFLVKGEVVHHKDEDRFNYRRANLKLKTKAGHTRDHSLERGRRMAELQCPQCLEIFIRPANLTFLTKGRGASTFCSPRCRGRFSREVQLHGLSERQRHRVSANLVRVFVARGRTEPVS
jgi:HNH endonuclease